LFVVLRDVHVVPKKWRGTCQHVNRAGEGKNGDTY
jgi:hypothetical protein